MATTGAHTVDNKLADMMAMQRLEGVLVSDFSSALNTNVPLNLFNKLKLQGINQFLCNWISHCSVGDDAGG